MKPDPKDELIYAMIRTFETLASQHLTKATRMDSAAVHARRYRRLARKLGISELSKPA